MLYMLHPGFLTANPHDMAAGKYTIVAQVIDGMDVLDKMEKIKVGELRLLCAWSECHSLYCALLPAESSRSMSAVYRNNHPGC